MNKSRLSIYSFVFSMLLLLGILLTQAPNASSGNLIGGEFESATGCSCTGTTSNVSCNEHYSDCSGTITLCDVDSSGESSSTCGTTSGGCSGPGTCTTAFANATCS